MLKEGTRIAGKWTGAIFQIEQPLGIGANGEVYLVRSSNGRAAMKVCERSADIALEWALLEKLSPSSPVFPKPMLIDDEAPRTFFYVMEWIPGEPLHRVLPRLDIKSFGTAVEQVLRALVDLHATGHAFCDIKPENILVSTSPSVRVRFVDVGGVTPFSRSVRQFTPYYDRAFWGLGTRRADAAYDLIACALVILLCMCGQPPASIVNRSPSERKVWLGKTLKKFPYAAFTPLLQDVLNGKVSNFQQFCEDWKRQLKPVVQHRPKTPAVSRQMQASAPRSSRSVALRQARTRRDWTEWVMWFSLGTAATVTLTAWVSFLGWFGS